LEVFLIGAIAKAIATTITYPLQTVQSVLRVRPEYIWIIFTQAGLIHSKVWGH